MCCFFSLSASISFSLSVWSYINFLSFFQKFYLPWLLATRFVYVSLLSSDHTIAIVISVIQLASQPTNKPAGQLALIFFHHILEKLCTRYITSIFYSLTFIKRNSTEKDEWRRKKEITTTTTTTIGTTIWYISTVNNTVNRLMVCLNGVTQILYIHTQRFHIFALAWLLCVAPWICAHFSCTRLLVVVHMCICVYFSWLVYVKMPFLVWFIHNGCLTEKKKHSHREIIEKKSKKKRRTTTWKEKRRRKGGEELEGRKEKKDVNQCTDLFECFKRYDRFYGEHTRAHTHSPSTHEEDWTVICFADVFSSIIYTNVST